MWLIWTFNKRRSTQELQDQTFAPFWIVGNRESWIHGSSPENPFFSLVLDSQGTSRMGGKPYGFPQIKKTIQSCGENVDSSEIPRSRGNLYESIKPFVNPGINYQTFSITAATGSDYTKNGCPRHFGTWNSFCVMPQLILRAICKRSWRLGNAERLPSQQNFMPCLKGTQWLISP